MVATTPDRIILRSDISLDFGGSYFIPNTCPPTLDFEIRIKKIQKNYEHQSTFLIFCFQKMKRFWPFPTSAEVSLILKRLQFSKFFPARSFVYSAINALSIIICGHDEWDAP